MKAPSIFFMFLMISLFDFSSVKAQTPKPASHSQADDIYTVVEVMPRPECGWTAFEEYLRTNLRYPEAALKEQKQGQVVVQFLVNTDGSLSDFKVVKGIGYGCDEEAIRLIKEGTKWTGGKLKGEPVRIRYLMKIPFKN